jgi:hypothetical protein
MLETPTPRRVQCPNKDSVSKLIFHSTSDPSFQCRESLNVSVPVILPSRNGQRAERLSNSDSIQSPRLLEACTGLPMYSQWKELTLDAEPSTQDGSNSSNGQLHSLETKRKPTRSWMFQVVLIPKTEISTCGNSKVVNNNNGISSMSMTGRKIQLKETCGTNSVSLLKKISTLLPTWERKDTLTSLIKISFLRLKTEEQAKDGTSTELQEPSNLDLRINPLISRAQVRVMSSNTTQPTQDGGRSGSSPTEIRPARLVKSKMLAMTDSSLLKINQTRKLNQLLLLKKWEEETHPNFG